jgi:lipoprotein NlpI
VRAPLAALVFLAATADPDQLQRHRNLGKAFYENPTTQYEAVTELEKALALAPDSARERVNYGLALLRAGQEEKGIAELQKAQAQDPKIPHTWFNIGMYHKQAGRYDEARAQLERLVELEPDDPICHYNLGVLYKMDRRMDDAIREWRRTVELDPTLAGPHFQLATAHRLAGRAEEAAREMAAFEEIKARRAGAAIKEDLDWGYYAELYDVVDPPVVPAEPAAVRVDRKLLHQGLDPATAGARVIDLRSDGVSDLLVWSSRGVLLFEGGETKVDSPLAKRRDVVDVADGDFDNDGFTDLVVVGRQAVSLYRQQAGAFRRHAASLPAGPFHRAAFVDYDHDYDLDLLLLGKASKLLRNEGASGFADRTADLPFVEGEAVAAAALDTVSDVQSRDIVVAYADRAGVLYRDLLGGRFQAVPLPAVAPGVRQVVAHDADADGWTDLTTSDAAGTRLLINDRKGSFTAGPQVDAPGPVLWLDLLNGGSSALVAGGLAHRVGRGTIAEGAPLAGWPAKIVAAAGGAFGEGRAAAFAVDETGALYRVSARGTPQRWLAVSLLGTKNLKLAAGAAVEVRVDRLYQKKTYHGTPLVFGLGDHATVETVRITWPNGLIQNEVRQPAGQVHRYKEAQRLSGSCPMIYTWNGAEFEFIADVLGVAPLGASAGDGTYFPVDHDEIIQIPGDSLRARDGAYEVRIVEELAEVTYLDHVRLVAVDRPESLEVFTNDKFKGPPFPEFRLFGVERRIPPVRARDHRGRDVRERVRRRDAVYADGFQRDMSGVAEPHHLDLDFGRAAADGRAILVLTGWVDWADGSTFLARAQEGGPGLMMPSLQVKDERGQWRTVIDDMGMPAGKTKAIVVDLTGKFLSASREVRIRTSLCLYWDEIFLAAETGAPDLRLFELAAEKAALGFHGFSEAVVHPERRQPERFVYASVQPTAMWNPTPGLYTRYGDVRELVASIDDHLLLMASGDEVRLTFDAAALPPLAQGWRRDFLLVVDGWAKDRDPNTAYAHSVEPLPYHGMPQYPYAAPHRFPDDPEHAGYRKRYNTRPALRLIRPLTEGLVAGY